MALKAVPLFDRVIIEPIGEEVTSSGIIMPASREKLNEGIVVAIGSDAKGVEIGWRVIYPIWAANEISVRNKTLKLLKVDEIEAVLVEE